MKCEWCGAAAYITKATIQNICESCWREYCSYKTLKTRLRKEPGNARLIAELHRRQLVYAAKMYAGFKVPKDIVVLVKGRDSRNGQKM